MHAISHFGRSGHSNAAIWSPLRAPESGHKPAVSDTTRFWVLRWTYSQDFGRSGNSKNTIGSPLCAAKIVEPSADLKACYFSTFVTFSNHVGSETLLFQHFPNFFKAFWLWNTAISQLSKLFKEILKITVLEAGSPNFQSSKFLQKVRKVLK